MDDLTQFQEMIVAALGKAGDDLKKKIEDALASGRPVRDALQSLRREMKQIDDLTKAVNKLDKLRLGTPTTAAEKRSQRVVAGLARQRQRDDGVMTEEEIRAERIRVGRIKFATDKDLQRQRRKYLQERWDARKASRQSSGGRGRGGDDDDGIHMGRLPIASVPAALFGNKAAGARVGYALGERSGFGRWAGLAAGAGAATVIGSGFAASPSGTDVITKPLTILGAVIGAVVLPALVNFGAVLLTVADRLRGNLPSSPTEVAATVIGGGAAYKFVQGALGGGGAMAALTGGSGIGGALMSGGKAVLGAAGTALRAVAPLAGAYTAADMALSLFDKGSSAGESGWQKAGKWLTAAAGGVIGGIGGSIVAPGAGTATGATLGASLGWQAGEWLFGGAPEAEKRSTFSENKKAILDAMVSAMGQPKIGTDFEQMNRDIQMATMQSELDARLLRVMQEALDPMLQEQKETNNLLRPK